MEAILHPYHSTGFAHESKKVISRQFLDWCKAQEKDRMLWLAIIVSSHGCIITPLTALVVAFSVNSILLWILATGAMGMALVTNLAALPTKITIPVFVLSLVIDIVIIISCIAVGFDYSAV